MNQDWRMKRKLEVYKGHGEEITGLEYSINGDYLASGGNDNVVNIWS
jgi:WD40 repeat protein